MFLLYGKPQSRQSARLFLQSSELGPPRNPLTRRRVCPPPLIPGEGHTRLRERGWEVPIRTRGHTLWYNRYICTLCCIPSHNQVLQQGIQSEKRQSESYEHVIRAEQNIQWKLFVPSLYIYQVIIHICTVKNQDCGIINRNFCARLYFRGVFSTWLKLSHKFDSYSKTVGENCTFLH